MPSLCLTWSVSDDLDVDDKKWTRDLVPNGSEIRSRAARKSKTPTPSTRRRPRYTVPRRSPADRRAAAVAARFLDACFATSAWFEDAFWAVSTTSQPEG